MCSDRCRSTQFHSSQLTVSMCAHGTLRYTRERTWTNARGLSRETATHDALATNRHAQLRWWSPAFRGLATPSSLPLPSLPTARTSPHRAAPRHSALPLCPPRSSRETPPQPSLCLALPCFAMLRCASCFIPIVPLVLPILLALLRYLSSLLDPLPPLHSSTPCFSSHCRPSACPFAFSSSSSFRPLVCSFHRRCAVEPRFSRSLPLHALIH